MRLTPLSAVPLIVSALAFATPVVAQNAKIWKTLDGRQPLVVAHRGASGYLPEHTLEAYRRAIELGADFVEPDLVSTKDGVLIARHEPLLDGTTDVASRNEFASKKTTKTLDGIRTTGFFAGDFTLAEIKRLRAVQPNGARSKQFDGQYEIPTLDDIIRMVQSESAGRGRTIGIYPETKHPTFHFVNGLPLEDKLLQTLTRFELTYRNSPVIIQSFEVANLKYLRSRTNVRLVQLIDADDVALDGRLTYAAPYDKPYDFAITADARGYGDLVTDAQLQEIRTYADGIGPWKRYIVTVRSVDANADGRADDVNGDGSVNDADKSVVVSDLIERAHRAGLFVHAYTFRNEPGTLARDYNGDPRNEYIQFFNLGLDGLFTDFTDTAVSGRQTSSLMIQ
ncbi:MAG: glycerophosphodiester phosphodiesterase [Bryobacteraceae bacterium]|nr:glycerophosphodiester phosphodiesterase [Bryobacteraceae bacterium]